jgi:SAM-dependent methyltransferase
MLNEELKQRIESYPSWFYNFNLDGIETSPDNVVQNQRHQRRKELFLDPFIRSEIFTGKRVLDIGCCSGFWSFHVLDAGAQYVLGVDAWPQAVEQAHLVAEVRNIPTERCEFRLEDAYNFLAREDIKDSFDIVLCFGFMYHIKKPIELLEQIFRVTRDLLILDTTVLDSDDALISLRPDAGKQSYVETARDRLAFVPSEKAIHWMMDEIGFNCRTIKHNFLPGTQGVLDYLEGERMAFICSKHSELSALHSDLKEKPESPPETLLEYLAMDRERKRQERSKGWR